jgi:hypothetical protein
MKKFLIYVVIEFLLGTQINTDLIWFFDRVNPCSIPDRDNANRFPGNGVYSTATVPMTA